MFKHVAAFKLATDDPELKSTQAKEFADLIAALVGQVPGIVSMEVGIDLGRIDTHYDVVLTSTHESYETLEAYQAHPKHQAVIAHGNRIVSDRAIVDFEF
jgi:hypothetical protein